MFVVYVSFQVSSTDLCSETYERFISHDLPRTVIFFNTTCTVFVRNGTGIARTFPRLIRRRVVAAAGQADISEGRDEVRFRTCFLALLLIEDYVRMRFWTELSVAVMILFLGVLPDNRHVLFHEAPTAILGLAAPDLYFLVFASLDFVPEHSVRALVHTLGPVAVVHEALTTAADAAPECVGNVHKRL